MITNMHEPVVSVQPTVKRRRVTGRRGGVLAAERGTRTREDVNYPPPPPVCLIISVL